LDKSTVSRILKDFIFSSVHKWNDVRIFHKQASSLAKKYVVEFHAPANFIYREIQNVKIKSLPLWDVVSNRKKIRKKLFQRIKRSEPQIFHFHYPELIPLGLYIKLLKRRTTLVRRIDNNLFFFHV